MKTTAIFALLLGCLLAGTGCTRHTNKFSVSVEEKTALPSNFASANFTETAAAIWIEHLSASYRRISFELKCTDTDSGIHFDFELPVTVEQMIVKGKPLLVPVFNYSMVNKNGGFTVNFAPRLYAYQVDGDFCFDMPVKVSFAKNDRARYENDPNQLYSFSSIQEVLPSLAAGDTVTFCDEGRTLAKDCSNIIEKTFTFRNKGNALEISSNSGSYKLDLLEEDFGAGTYNLIVRSDIMRKAITAADIPSRTKN